MSVEIARYQFHSWARKGISNNIVDNDDLGAGTSAAKERTSIDVSLTVNGAAKKKNFTILGPGDVIGVNQNMVVRTEPLNWITDFEPNYLAFIEFYDEDFAWRYTPAAAAGDRLRPWLFLLVLEENEFERSKRKVPLPSITIKNGNVFPPAEETWLWAHVHSNADIPDAELSDYEKFILSLNNVVNADPDQLYCRLMSPRKLQPNKAYYAFLIPAFETGRLAGLEQPTTDVVAQSASWDNNGAKGEMPIYFEWYFRTGSSVDFESLVKLLEPRPMDPRVGIREMDCSRPGFVRADDSSLEIPGTSPPIIGLEGALKSPDTVSTIFPHPPSENDFQVELEKIVNLPFTITGEDESGDPIVSIPFYGAKHAKRSTNENILLDVDKSTWLHDLNKDPRTRVPAGFATLVVQKNQEDLMRKAWAQVTAIIEANRLIKSTVFYMNVGLLYVQKTFTKLPEPVMLSLSSPLFSKIMGSPTTLHHQMRASRFPKAAMSGAFRRITRPNGKISKSLSGRGYKFNTLVTRLNDGTISAAKPKYPGRGLPTTESIAGNIFKHSNSAWLKWILSNLLLIAILFLVLVVIISIASGSLVAAVVLVVAGAIAYRYFQQQQGHRNAADSLMNPERESSEVNEIPPRPSFTLLEQNQVAVAPPPQSQTATDSPDAKNFRTALKDLAASQAVREPNVEPAAFNFQNAYQKVSKAIHPHHAYAMKLSKIVKFPNYISIADTANDTTAPENILPVMAYPDFEEPMYKALTKISDELLLPNLKLVPYNCISLLRTNQKFIESYMVGLNHEMGRELLWREYPTDERGSYFRQFWDVNGVIRPATGKTEAENAEDYKDIKPIHTWPTASELGRHNNLDAEGDAQQLVLVIRGDLLKRYPNTIIFAQKAISSSATTDPVIDQDLDTAEFATHVKFPLYKAEIEPDIKFFGFDLTLEEARGTELSTGFSDKLGWFFVIQEIPGEPRFGMDLNFDTGSDGLSWDDLAWTNLPADATFIKGSVKPTGAAFPELHRWGANSANMAYILFQKPSMVAIHATDMLEKL
jgi:hypothetical protein